MPRRSVRAGHGRTRAPLPLSSRTAAHRPLTRDTARLPECQPMRPSHMKNNLRIAVIEGDGIGKEVVPEGLRVLEATAAKFNIDIRFDHFDFASCDYYAKHGTMMPEDWKAQIGGPDAIFFGAVGWPRAVPEHVSLWGSPIKFRPGFHQNVNLSRGPLRRGVLPPLPAREPGPSRI